MPAAPFSDTKILIVLNKDGGEDSYHRYLRRDPARLAEIATHRGPISFTTGEVESYTGGHLDANWCLHPALNLLKQVWEDGHMAITHGVGPMVTDLGPLTTPQVRAATYNGNQTGIVLPLNLVAHDWQQYIQASMVARRFNDGVKDWELSESGFLGRLATRFRAFTANQGSGGATPPSLPLGTAIASRGTFNGLALMDGLTRPLNIPTSNGGKFATQYQVNAQTTEVLARINAIMATAVDDPRQNVFRKIHNGAVSAAGFFNPVIERAHNGGSPVYAVDTHFTNFQYGYRGGLKTAARMIEQMANGATGLPNRMILLCSHGSYDTHDAQGKVTGPLADLFTNEAMAVSGFYNAMMALDPTGVLWSKIVITDTSEFSRTLLANGSNGGTDHGYARAYTMWGGAVRGKGKDGSTGHFGQWPSSYGIYTGGNNSPWTGGGSDDINGNVAGGGTLRPWLSSEQYWEPILRWFGADNDDIAATLLRRSAFAGASPQLLL